MPQSFSNIIVQIIFATQGRRPWLKDRAICQELYAYMGEVLKALGCTSIAINGSDDHVHVLCVLSRTQAISTVVEQVKKEPSKWIKGKGRAYSDFYWQRGYAAFSVSASQVPAVKKYILLQEEHHKRMTFQEEFRLICAKHGIVIDGRYAWD